MKSIFVMIAAFFFAFATPSSLLADVTSKPCPYSCKSAGYKKKNCKDWKKGNLCFVDYSGKKQQARKGVTSKKCPYSCKMEGLGKKKCKDWKEGNTCYVQKL